MFRVATKEHRRLAKDLIEGLESRVHSGPPIEPREIACAREFLVQNDFPRASDYFTRLGEVQSRLVVRSSEPPRQGKRNYGGEAGGCWMQVQSAYDHIIISTCYAGEFNTQRGRIKLSHRFNQAGRVDFIEVKLLKSLHPALHGEYRKLVVLKDYQGKNREWHEAEAFVLPVLPRELIFLYPEIFRVPRGEMLSWLINIGHRLASDLFESMHEDTINGVNSVSDRGTQLPLKEIAEDAVAVPILEKACSLQASVEMLDSGNALISYSRKLSPIATQVN